MNLKKALKTLKLNESSISMILGAIIIVAIGMMVINFFKSDENGVTIPAEQTSESDTVKDEQGRIVHTVAKGENLWSISEKYLDSGYSWKEIAEENDLGNPGQIEEGQLLVIPAEIALATTEETQIVTTQTVTETEAEVQTEAINGGTYTVVRGDSLWDIAVRAYGDGYRWVEIAGENDLVNPNIIHAGNVLRLPR